MGKTVRNTSSKEVLGVLPKHKYGKTRRKELNRSFKEDLDIFFNNNSIN